jgi:hypothetical protein
MQVRPASAHKAHVRDAEAIQQFLNRALEREEILALAEERKPDELALLCKLLIVVEVRVPTSKEAPCPCGGSG